jgi:L-glutamine-phosphate cytidylyltransferase
VTRAIVLAAGEGTRLRPHTADRPKCLVPLRGRPLLSWQLDALRECGIDDVTIVTGYRADQLEPFGARRVHNPRFDSTNMVASLMCARDLLDGSADVVITYGDLVFEPRVVETLLGTDAALATTVDQQWRTLWSERMADPLADAETLRLDPTGNVIELGRRPRSLDEIEGQYMGLILARAAVARTLVAVYDSLDPTLQYEGRARDQMYMTTFLQHIIDHTMPVAAATVQGGWLEVDTVEDLATYERLGDEGGLDRLCRLPVG